MRKREFFFLIQLKIADSIHVLNQVIYKILFYGYEKERILFFLIQLKIAESIHILNQVIYKIWSTDF